MTPATRARLQILGAAALFSTGGAAIKGSTLSSFQVAGFRSLVAGIAVAALVPASRRSWGSKSARVGIAYAATLVLFVAANKLTTAANTIFLQSTAPIYVLLLGPFMLGERLQRRDLVFMAIAAAGLSFFFIGVEPPRQTAPDPLRGNVLALASGVSWALTLMGLRWLSAAADSSPAQSSVVMGSFIAFVACAPWMFPVTQARLVDVLLILYLGIFQIGAAYALVTAAMRHLRALEASLLVLLEPVLNPIWTFIVHGEKPGGWALLGGALVLLATTGKSVWEARVSSV